MADPIACACPICRIADHATEASTEVVGVRSAADAAGLLLGGVVKVGLRAGWTDHQIATLMLRAGGEMLAQHLAGAQAAQPQPVPPAGPGGLH